MKLNDVQATKHALVTEILAQDVYTPASGVWCRLFNRLMTLSQDDLACLKMLIDLKVKKGEGGH
jgi:hypothetical protein